MSKEELELIVEKFHKTLPRPGINKLIIVWHDIKNNQSHSWTNGDKPGVYIFLDSNENLLYIGKASSGRDLRARLRGYFDRNGAAKNNKHGAEETQYVGLLALPEDHGFEAPAIEEWLIEHLQPKENKIRMRSKVNKNARRAAEKELKKLYPEEYRDLVNRYSRVS